VRQVDAIDAMGADFARHRRLVLADPLADTGERLVHDQPVRDREPIL
jgi:hypothetical protein